MYQVIRECLHDKQVVATCETLAEAYDKELELDKKEKNIWATHYVHKIFN